MSLKITPSKEIKAYYKNDSLNQSNLKRLIKGLNYYKSKNTVDPDAKYIRIGSAVDVRLTGKIEEFGKQFHFSQLDKYPSEGEVAIVKLAIEKFKENADDSILPMDLVVLSEQLIEAMNELSWQTKWKHETRMSKIIEKCSNYYADSIKADGKTILSIEDQILLADIITPLISNENTGQYFNRSEQSDDKYTNYKYQLPIYFNHSGIHCKALLDLLIINHKDNYISAVDLKTMSGDTIDFPKSIKNYRYDIQAAWYVLAVEYYKKEHQIEHYKTLPFKFIVESTTKPGNPLIYEMSESLLDIGKNGKKSLLINGIEICPDIKGYECLLKEYKEYEEQGWKKDFRIKESIKVDWNGIVE